ncbi:MAG: alpha/beta fold hydrolase [Terriglobales bacterium]
MSVLALGGLLALGALPAVAAQANHAPENAARLARQATADLAAGHYAAVEAHFVSAMKAALPTAKLAALWTSLTTQFGAFQRITGVKSTTMGGDHNEDVGVAFAHKTIGLKWSINPQGQIVGLHGAAPPGAAQTSTWSPPPYARPARFQQMAVTVVDGHFRLPGYLTLPRGRGPFPAVVLVPGSGPEDANEQIGPNRVFQDLAWGLSSRGIAVLRYTKRTRQYGSAAAGGQPYTVRQGYIEDARAAVAMLAANAEINPRRIFLAGHSMGGYLAPRIAANDPQIAGIAILDGPSRPFLIVLRQQLIYLARVEHAPRPRLERALAQLQADQREIANPHLEPAAVIRVPPGVKIPAAYFLDLRHYSPTTTAARLKIPILVIQGSRDYNVRLADFRGWQRALRGHANARCLLIPGLNHLLMPGPPGATGLSKPTDELRPNHVSTRAIEALSRWIQGAASAS